MTTDDTLIKVSPKVWTYVSDYSKYRDVNEYLTSILGAKFREYRRMWRDASILLKVFDFPLFLAFETMFRCNLKCTMCMQSSPEKQKYAYNGKLPFDIFRKIMKEASSYRCPSLTFGGTSEPLLDTRLIDMICLARESGFLDIMVNTNATLLSVAMSRRLIKSGLIRLRIGFDGLTAAIYEKIRVGANFEAVKNNIIRFMKIRDEMNSRLPVVRVSCVRLSKNDQEIKGFIKLWKPIVDYVSIQMYRPHDFTKQRLEMGPRTKAVATKIVCSQPFERLYIRGNGDVHACCNVFGPKVGNIFKNSIFNIWHSGEMCVLRRALKNGTSDKIYSCRECLGNAYNI